MQWYDICICTVFNPLRFIIFKLADMLGMIGFGGEEQFVKEVNPTKIFVLINYFTVFYKNIGWGNFEGYEKLEAVMR